MQPGIHPEYRDVVFHDTTADTYFVIGSTLKMSRTIEYQGKTYPYMTIDVSSASHPYYTGKQKANKSDGRVAKFNKKYSFGGKK